MEKREFIKAFCGLGMCACAGSALAPLNCGGATNDQKPEAAGGENWRLKWRLNHAKRQFCMLLQKIEPEIPPDTRQKIMREMGRNCAKSLGWAEKYKGNPEGFFEHMRQHGGERLSFDEAKRKITIVTPERDCVCPVIDSSQTPDYYCDCSLGWQAETYETILGDPVTVDLKESVLRGSKRCVFEVTILHDTKTEVKPIASNEETGPKTAGFD